MKFAKQLHKNIEKYNKDVAEELWFSYKPFKKKIKHIATRYFDIIASRKNSPVEYQECCICLESENLMKTFCCHNHIHHACLVHTLTFTNSLCPMCRTKIEKVIQFNKENVDECFDAEIISVISYIHIDFMKFSCVYQKDMISDQRIANKYYEMNLIALEKICKKMDKHLLTNTRPYFRDIAEKHKIPMKAVPEQKRKFNMCIIF